MHTAWRALAAHGQGAAGSPTEALSTFAELPLTLTIYTCRITSRHAEEDARRTCLHGFVAALTSGGQHQVIIESRDEHRDRRDRRTLQESLAGRADVTYNHVRHKDDPLVWIADAYAWTAGAKLEWRRRLHPSTHVVKLRP